MQGSPIKFKVLKLDSRITRSACQCADSTPRDSDWTGLGWSLGGDLLL